MQKKALCRPLPPNRKKRRYFTACDAARIAREVIKDDSTTTPEEVLACIAKGLGFSHISLSRQRTTESGVSLVKPTISIVKLILKKSLPLLKAARWKALVAALGTLLSALDKLETLIDLIFDQPKQSKVEDAINPEKCKCKDQPKETTSNPGEINQALF